ncbi:flocculation protein FLO11-like [Cottoperca gobio]|uniref:Flocculation protein FLO11-like n=1 Tax=Cottoperca gobio TaxID=56716 RepID=A0A6J2PCQ0_COTGO|nr:flocculation protein FLO11-like [Cottoperca gobio]
MEAFNEMFGNHNVCVRHDPRLRKESIGGVPPHHHTVHSGTDHNSCHLCAQVRSKKGRRQSRTTRSKQRPGEQTVFSVGRFRVTHTDKKLHGDPIPLVSSGDQLDQSQDSEERKEGGYNLRSMFKDVRPPSEGSNGVAPNVGKRRKSVTIFGLRRCSDPTCMKVEEGGVRLAIQQQHVVLEELLQAENNEIASECDTKPGIKPETEPSNNQMPALPQWEAKTSGSVISPSSQSEDWAHGSKSGPEDGSKHGLSPEPHTNLMIKPSVGTTSASAPSLLPVPSHASSAQKFTTKKQRDAEDKVLKNEEAYDPGPLQTSTPIAPTTGSIPGFTPVIPTGQPEPCSSKGFHVTQIPPDPSSSPDLKSGFGATQALISFGSSPSSLYPIKTPSSDSLKTPISPGVFTPNPKLTLRNIPSEAAKTSAFPPALTPSFKLPSGASLSFGKSTSPLQAQTPSPALTARPKLKTMPVSPQTPSSSSADQNPCFGSSAHPISKSGSVTSVTSFTKGDMILSPLSLEEQELEGAIIQTTDEKTEILRVGILKKAKLLPVEGNSKASGLYSPPDQLSKNRLSSLPPSPSRPLSPSSPIESRMSSVTIVKASPDSKREFSVFTLVEEKETSTTIQDQKVETSEFRIESEKARISPAVGQGRDIYVSGVRQPESQTPETPGAEVRPRVSQEKDDMVEMEDIRDCKVTQVEEAERVEEELEKMVNI